MIAQPVDIELAERRLRMMTFPSQRIRILVGLTNRWFRLSGLPTDAEIINIGYNALTDEGLLLIRSDEFPIAPPGTVIPLIDLKIETREGR